MFERSGDLPDIGNSSGYTEKPNFWEDNKKWFLFGGAALLLVAALAAAYFLIAASKKKVPSAPNAASSTATTTESVPTLPSLENSSSTDAFASSTLPEAVELLSFSQFYQAPTSAPLFSLSNYKLPINVKIDVLNYYDLSRKISLDNSLSSLNANGFALIDNPSQNQKDFYGSYSYLASRKMPLLVTSDFLTYYHQNTLKLAYQSIEEEIFYNQLWLILKDLYNVSRSRYEARLAKIGNVNDRILEGERLSTAYFATALALLAPNDEQIDGNNTDKTKFSASEARTYYFNPLPYMSDSVNEELGLIQKAKGQAKSPVLLYSRDYGAFAVPAEYKGSAKLANFYLATVWLNSVFPIVYQDKQCPSCLLDKDDGRISLIASTFIAKDFSSDQRLKNHWALIYKLISYFKGLRDDLNYLYYDQSMKKMFGDNYDPETLFAEDNPDSLKNIDKLRESLLTVNFKKELGALDKDKDKSRLGFKFLADYYWPNDYIFTRLSTPEVGNYQGGAKINGISNVTACATDKPVRCNGFSLDLPALVTDRAPNSSAWKENTSYANYQSKLASLRSEIRASQPWQTNNFWASINIFKEMLNPNSGQFQAYGSTQDWRQRLFNEAAGSWVNLQLPADSWQVPIATSTGSGLSNGSSLSDNNYYIEPDYSLVQQMLADNEMVYGMFQALSVNQMLPSAGLMLQEENKKLSSALAIIAEELNNKALSADDQDFIGSFVSQYQVPNQAKDRTITIKAGSRSVNETLSTKLLALVYKLGDSNYIAIGPVFSYTEKH